jgi:hypothetical protein
MKNPKAVPDNNNEGVAESNVSSIPGGESTFRACESRSMNNLVIDPDTGKLLSLPSTDSEYWCVEKLSDSLLSDRWQVRSYKDALENRGKQVPWVVKDLLVSRTATLVSAQPHAMKSLSLLAASMEAVVTHKVWGRFEAPDVDSTLFIETEDPQWLVEARIRGLAKGLGIRGNEIPGFHFACIGPFDLLGERRRIFSMFEMYRPKFVVLSTLQNLLKGRDWNRQEDMQPILSCVLELSQTCPIILVTHSPWDKRAKRAAGTITQVANFATSLHYDKLNVGSKTLARVHTDSKAAGGSPDFHLELETEGPSSDPESVRRFVVLDKLPVAKKEEVLEALEEDPTATAKQIAERVGVSERYVQKLRSPKPKKKKR